MRLVLKQYDLERAVKLYLAAKGIVVTDREITCSFIAGRKGNGSTCITEIEDVDGVDEAILSFEKELEEGRQTALDGALDAGVSPDVREVKEALKAAPTPAPEVSEVPASEVTTAPSVADILGIDDEDDDVPFDLQEPAPKKADDSDDAVSIFG